MVRGGQLAGQVVDRVPVEEGVDRVTFRLLANRNAQVTIISPGGVRHEATARRTPSDAILRGISYEVRVEKPEAGAWQVVAAPAGSAESGAYMLQAIYEGSVATQWGVDLSRVYRPGSELPLSISVSQPVKEASVQATLRSASNNRIIAEVQGALEGQSVTLPGASATYNVELRITGSTASGTPFERTIVTSVAAIDPAQVENPASIR
jgi:hypothetical protein